MKKHIQWMAMLPVLALTAGLLSGCRFSVSLEMGNTMTGDTYPNAEAYQTGAFTYRADEVESVEIYWRSGEVEIVESDNAELSVFESGGELSEDAAMHYLLDGGTLRIRFCQSGAKIQVHSNDKRLTVEVPRGISISVHTTSAPVTADTLEQNSVLISVHSGNTVLGTVEAGSVDLSSSSGSIRADSVSARTLKCSASSGSVRIGALEADTAEVNTSSGSVDLTLAAAARVDVRTSSGKTTLRLPEGGAEVAYTASSGKLRTELAFERKGDLYVFGAGESSITVASSSGGLEIR